MHLDLKVRADPEGDPLEVETAVFEPAGKRDVVGPCHGPGIALSLKKCRPMEGGERRSPVQHLVHHDAPRVGLVPSPDPDPADLVFGQGAAHPFVVEPALAVNGFGVR